VITKIIGIHYQKYQNLLGFGVLLERK